MFKNLIIYRISPTWQPDWAQIDAALAKQPFEECGATQEKSVGWVPPRGEEHGAMVESVGGHSEDDCCYTSSIICPYCATEQSSDDIHESKTGLECDTCGGEFDLEVEWSASYTTTKPAPKEAP